MTTFDEELTEEDMLIMDGEEDEENDEWWAYQDWELLENDANHVMSLDDLIADKFLSLSRWGFYYV